ncbi:membrane metallo-endopeptidase-like 1 [Lucilia sericata]|uniref:membrane metallo-endopeptidase-like 1 n=1 Tax=Lucilia sericata TaxID=13632 RepID=UPI0018A87172|nr:membrane metallo-endopeptidase-like 1 [Lucilia sericata]
MKALNKFLIKLLIILINLMIIGLKQVNTKEVSEGPCENFYEYNCSNYSQQNPNPNYSEITQQLNYQINEKLLQLLDKEIQIQDYDSRIQTFYDQMQMYLESCEKETQRNLRKYLKEITPSKHLNWPLLVPKEQWLETDKKYSFWNIFRYYKTSLRKFDFWSLLGEMQSYGLNNVLVNHQIIRNEDNSLNIWLAPTILENGGSLPDNAILKVLLMTLGIKDTETIIQQLKATDLKWQNILESYAGHNTKSQVTTLTDLAELYPQLNLKLYLENLLGSELNKLSDITIENPEYFEYLNHKQWTNQQLEHLCNYLMIKFLFYLAEDSTKDFNSRECINDLRHKFDLAVNYFTYRLFFKREADHFNEALNTLETEIKDIMAKYFTENHLNLTRKQIIYLKSKLYKININNGNLPKIFNIKSIQTFYQDLPHLDRSNYYKNHLLLLKHRFRKSLYYAQNQTHYIVSDNSMGGVSSPFYVPQQNMVVVPFGSFQLPLFNYSQTPLQQLSLFGFILAHELTHAFDTTGLNYDKQGLPLTLPSHIMDHANFSNSLECMQHQQPTEEIDERIADLFAIRVVYRTYLEYYAKDYQADWPKEFFRNLAQFFCGKDNLNFIDHDTDAIRLQQILMNFQPFSEAFGCVEGSPMNPKTKCRLY